MSPRKPGKWVPLDQVDSDGKLSAEGISGDDHITIIDGVAHVWRPLTQEDKRRKWRSDRERRRERDKKRRQLDKEMVAGFESEAITREKFKEQDAAFRGALLDAIEAGLEKIPEVPPNRTDGLPKRITPYPVGSYATSSSGWDVEPGRTHGDARKPIRKRVSPTDVTNS